MWRSLVAHFVRDEGAAGSNPVIPIFLNPNCTNAGRLPWPANRLGFLDRQGWLSHLRGLLQNHYN